MDKNTYLQPQASVTLLSGSNFIEGSFELPIDPHSLATDPE